ncbi:benzoate/H(+) symporter BenE family transporter [Cytobacillus depressus]|uniref:Benzoate/H(+) symporter BenE family transporter n=1 Tax=Cytobacillus depressus TaxID=1602942 RepID=A0A6L3V2M7_9BACI|nr:benzoate/H(+) symporter BenE family transporter [Cytobacillus depressus]KAB2330503.1 benzoate/H(+) symporter BenE family transporter [Cytobacillus depressus]
MSSNKIYLGVKSLSKHIQLKTISSGIVAAIFGCTGPALIIIGGAEAGGLSDVQTISWLFAVYFFGGLLGIFLALKYRQPIAGAYTIAGAVLVAGSLTQFSINEAVGAYLVSSIIVLILGITGLIEKVMHRIPVPIIMGMIVGVMIRFATELITAVKISPLIAGSAIAVYLLSIRFIKGFPPVLSALVVSVLLAVLTKQFHFHDIKSVLIFPQIVIPSFSFKSIISISIPLSILVICTENAQAIGVLMAQKYRPPINPMTIWSGIGSIFASFFGGHAINIAGSMTAICASEDSGTKEGRYAAVFVNGTLFSTFGIFASIIVPFIIAMPGVIVSSIAGLAMIGVLASSLKLAFSDSKFQMGALFALIIGMSGVNFFNISSPFWAIIGSLIISIIIESDHFKIKQSEELNE